MKVLFWLLLIGVAVVFTGFFVSLLKGLRNRPGRRQREIPAPTAYQSRSPLEGRRAALFLRLCEAYPEKRVLCDVPYGRFLAADDGSAPEGVAPLLICDGALRPETVVVWGEVDVPEAALASAGIALRRTGTDDDLLEGDAIDS